MVNLPPMLPACAQPIGEALRCHSILPHEGVLVAFVPALLLDHHDKGAHWPFFCSCDPLGRVLGCSLLLWQGTRERQSDRYDKSSGPDCSGSGP